MNESLEPGIRVRVDPTNPGQFFACCGLLELADRLWGGVEGWYAHDGPFFCLSLLGAGNPSIADLIREAARAGLAGELSPVLQREREALEEKRRQLKREQKALAADEEERRKELGSLLREGFIMIRKPFDLLLDWWQWDGDDIPKTWAGRQEVLRIALAALASSQQAFTTESPFDYWCVLRPVAQDAVPLEGASKRKGQIRKKEPEKDKVEPFYFDSRRGSSARPIDIGFAPDSLHSLGMTSAAYPAVEFLCLVGLQRFRPSATGKPRVFDYYTWRSPLAACVAPLAVCGLLDRAGNQGFRFENAFRTDQRKHKGFTAATPI